MPRPERPPADPLAGRTAFISGGSRGIGCKARCKGSQLRGVLLLRTHTNQSHLDEAPRSQLDEMDLSQINGTPLPRVPSAPRAGLAPDAVSLHARRLQEVVAVFKGAHPETGEELRVQHPAPQGFAWPDAPAQQDVFAPDYAPGEIAEIAQKLRKDAGFK
jgi:hypothetical protein